jgi:hypothetical protein
VRSDAECAGGTLNPYIDEGDAGREKRQDRRVL